MNACELENLILRNMIERNITHKFELPTVTQVGDGEFDIDGDCIIFDVNIDKLEIKFNRVNGHLSLINCDLKDISGLPVSVEKSLILTRNQIDSLEGFSTEVGGFIDISYNHLINLYGLNSNYNGELDVRGNFIVGIPDSKKYKLKYENNFVIQGKTKVQKENPGNGITKMNSDLAIEEFKNKFYSSPKVLEAFKIKGEDFLIKFLNEAELSNSNLNLDLTELKEWVYRQTNAKQHKDIFEL